MKIIIMIVGKSFLFKLLPVAAIQVLVALIGVYGRHVSVSVRVCLAIEIQTDIHYFTSFANQSSEHQQQQQQQ